jgi:hypothetical protein
MSIPAEDVMGKGFLIGLFTISVIVGLRIEAYAGCVNVGGTLLCATWITASEICAVTLATKGSHAKASTTALDCGYEECEVTCTVSGTVKEEESKDKRFTHNSHKSGGKSCKPGDNDCGISGFTFCEAPTDDEHQDKEAKSKIVREPFVLTERHADLPLRETKKIKDEDCKDKDSGGSVCQKSIELDPRRCYDCCSKDGNFLTFTAQEFFAEVKVCPHHGKHDECVTLVEKCKVNENAIKFGKSVEYTCTVVK